MVIVSIVIIRKVLWVLLSLYRVNPLRQSQNRSPEPRLPPPGPGQRLNGGKGGTTGREEGTRGDKGDKPSPPHPEGSGGRGSQQPRCEVRRGGPPAAGQARGRVSRSLASRPVPSGPLGTSRSRGRRRRRSRRSGRTWRR